MGRVREKREFFVINKFWEKFRLDGEGFLEL